MTKTQDEGRATEEWKKCRICLLGKSKGRLLSICNCKGSLGLVHKECQQKWLTVKKTNKCELCNTNLNVKRIHKALKDWLFSKDNNNQFSLVTDLIKGMIVVAITFWALYLVIPNCIRMSNSILTTVILVLAVIFLIGMTCLWFGVCFDHHCKAYQIWRTNRYKYVLKKQKINVTNPVVNIRVNPYVADWNDNGIALVSNLRMQHV